MGAHSYIINVLDLETFEENNKIIPYCGCVFINNETIIEYYSNDLILKILNSIIKKCKNCEKIEIYVHNLNFDGFLIIENLTENLIQFDLISNKTDIYSIRFKYCNKIFIFKCSYKIIPVSLKKLEKFENHQKLEFPHKFVKKETLYYTGNIPAEKFWNDSKSYQSYLSTTENKNYFDLKIKSISYCLNDVMLTQKILKNIFKIIDLENTTIKSKILSAPNLSHMLFFKKYNYLNINETILLEHENYIRFAYFGGRCEVFGNLIKGEHIKYFDFSGMYGQCMLENFHIGEGNYENLTQIRKPGFYNITYNSSFKFLPVLPVHYNESLFFCNGINTGTFWYEEILLFEKMGGEILQINNAFVYSKEGKVFEQFINNFNSLKEKDGYYKFFGKLMINSLYGGMALKTRETFQYITFSEAEFENIYKETTVENFYKINKCYIILIKNDYKSENLFKKKRKKISIRNVSYAAAIAAKARIKLYLALTETMDTGGRLLYCDTDSIYAAFSKKNLSKKSLTFEWINFYQDGVFISPKTYALKTDQETTIKIKGISNASISLEILKKKFFNNEKIIFENQNNFKKLNYNLFQYNINKEISLANYSKRNFINNKKSTIPINFKNIQ